jgi:hypothetical protein
LRKIPITGKNHEDRIRSDGRFIARRHSLVGANAGAGSAARQLFAELPGYIGVRGDSLFAICRTVDGRGQRTNLPQVSRCVGDIGNNNGNLQCNYADGGPPAVWANAAAAGLRLRPAALGSRPIKWIPRRRIL